MQPINYDLERPGSEWGWEWVARKFYISKTEAKILFDKGIPTTKWNYYVDSCLILVDAFESMAYLFGGEELQILVSSNIWTGGEDGDVMNMVISYLEMK